jgi:hypothetical protein
MSRLLASIEDRLRVESDIAVRGELQAKKAAYIARAGDFDASRSIIASVRQVFGDGRSARVTAFIMIAEGLTTYFEQLGPSAIDRFKRAQLLGDLSRDAEVGAVAAAWRAHLEFEASAYSACAQSLKQSFALAGTTTLSALSRCAAVLFTAFALVGNREQAQKWFMKGREHALAEGDQATIRALVLNKAAFDGAHLWARRCQGLELGEHLQLARSELTSAANLQNLVKISAHGDYVALSDVRLLILEENFKEALDKMGDLVGKGPFPSGHFNHPWTEVAKAYCNARLGHVEAALDCFASCREASFNSLDTDDRLVVAWMINEISVVDPRFLAPELAADRLQTALSDYRNEMASIADIFAEFSLK